MLNIVYMGTPQFAVLPLKKLIENNYNIVAVITQPDRQKNRKGQLLFTPVKKFAAENNLKVYQFEKIRKDGVEILKELNADLFITCAYGQILSKEIIDIPKYGIFNIHASLLPKYRGAAPAGWALINGEEKTGITIMRTDEGIDTGDIILKNAITINENENSNELLERLSELGAKTILQAIKQLQDGIIKYTKQDDKLASYYPMFKKSDSKIDFSLSAQQINNKIRGLNFGFAYLNGNMIKIHKAIVIDNEKTNKNIGEIIISDVKKGLYISCGKGVLRLLEIQLAGGKKMADTELLKGKKIPVGSILTPEP